MSATTVNKAEAKPNMCKIPIFFFFLTNI